MNILVTGATGFIGRNFIQYVNEQQVPDVSLILVAQNEIKGYKTIINRNYRIEKSQFGDLKVDAVVHLGGSIPTTSIVTTYSDTRRYAENINSTINLLQELPNIPSQFIFASSVMVYEATKECITENSRVNPGHPYGMSKVFCEAILRSWAVENDVPLQILRIGQCYGAGENTGLLIPMLIDCALENREFNIFSDGSERRSFIHVSDVARGIFKSISLKQSNIINLAGGVSYSVLEIAKKVFEIERKEKLLKVMNGNYQTNNFVYDINKMHQFLGKEEIVFDEGLKKEYMNKKIKISDNSGEGYS